MIKKGDTIRTVQHPHQNKNFYVDVVLWPKSKLPVLACTDENGTHVNLLLSKSFKPTNNHKVDLIQQIKLGCKKALREYVKVYKQVPSIKLINNGTQ